MQEPLNDPFLSQFYAFSTLPVSPLRTIVQS